MDLAKLASELRPDIIDNTKQIQTLLPKPQKNRSYNDIETKKPKLVVSLEPFYKGEFNKHMIIKFYVRWLPGDVQFNETTSEEVYQYAKDFLYSNSNPGLKDYATVEITQATKQYITYEWNIDAWIKLNFIKKPEFHAPTTFVYKYKNSIPTFFQTRINEIDLKSFITKRFQYWLDHGRIHDFQRDDFQFVKKLVSSLFQYVIDFQKAEIRVSLKQSVIVTAFVAATVAKNKNKFSKSEKGKLEKDLDKISSVSRLDKYIKSL